MVPLWYFILESVTEIGDDRAGTSIAFALQEDMENKKVDVVTCWARKCTSAKNYVRNCGAGLRNVRIELTTSGL